MERLRYAALARDDHQIADSLAGLVYTIGSDRGGRPQEAVVLAPIAEIAALRAGDEHILSKMWTNTGLVFDAVGDIEEADALRVAGRALAISEETVGAQSYLAGHALNALAEAHRRQGDAAAALEAVERALAIFAESSGPDSPIYGQTLSRRATIHVLAGRRPAARADIERAIAILGDRLGADYRGLAEPLLTRAELALRSGRAEAAVRDLERALTLAASGDPRTIARGRFLLARSLAAAGRDPERARDLALQARAFWAGRGAAAETATPGWRAALAERRAGAQFIGRVRT